MTLKEATDEIIKSLRNKEDNLDERVNRLQTAETELHEFAKANGFAYTRPQDFKYCIVIRWNWHSKRKINYDKLEEYTKVSHAISDKFKLWDPLLMGSAEFRLVKAGIYCFTQGYGTYWAIPSWWDLTQEFVLKLLPKWAKVTKKPHKNKGKS